MDRRHWHAGQRWAAAAAAILALLVLTSLSWREGESPDLGVAAVADGDQLRIARVRPAGLAWNAGIRPGDVVIAAAGPPQGDRADPAAIAAGPSVTVRSPEGVIRSASVDRLTQEDTPRGRLALLAIGWCFVAIGCAVFLLATELRAAGLFLAFALVGGVALITAAATPTGPAWALALEFIAVAAFGTLTLLLFLAFPADRLRSRAGRWLAGGALAVFLALLVGYGATLAGDGAGYAVLQPTLHASLAAQLIGAVALLLLAGRDAPGRREHQRALQLVSLGAVAGLLPLCLLALVPSALGYGYLVRPEAAVLSIILLPVGLGTAILGGQFLGVTRLVRRGLVALVVWVALLLAYTLAFEAARRYLAPQHMPLDAAFEAPLVGIAVVASTFPLAQHWLRRTLETRLFRDLYDYAATLEALATTLAQLDEVGAIAECALVRLGQTLGLSWATLVLDVDSPGLAARRWTWPPVHRCPVGTSLSPDTTLPLIADGLAIGSLALGPKRHDVTLLPEDRALVTTAAPLIATALQSATLVHRLEEQVAALATRERELAALSARLLRVQEEERRSLALDLHDEPLQGAILLAREVGEVGGAQGDRWRRQLDDLIAALRAICEGLRPPILDDLGLVPALERLVQETRARGDLDVSLCLTEAEGAFGRLEAALETGLYRAAQEGLHNTLKHASASQVRVRLAREGARIRLEIADDGRGLNEGDGSPPPRMGLVGMRERLRPWGGEVTLVSPPGGGTVVSVVVEGGGEQ